MPPAPSRCCVLTTQLSLQLRLSLGCVRKRGCPCLRSVPCLEIRAWPNSLCWLPPADFGKLVLSSWRGSCALENRNPLGTLSPEICIWRVRLGVERECIAILYAQPRQATRSFCAQVRLELTTSLPPAHILTLLCMHQQIAPPKGSLCRLELLPLRAGAPPSGSSSFCT